MSQSRDEISAKLGSMLLKGYKMLADSCPSCNNVLMQDKKGVVICVSCGQTGIKQEPNVPTNMEIGHKLAERGYSDGIPYRPNASRNPESACYAEDVLLKEIKRTAGQLESQEFHDGNFNEMNARLLQIKYIRECAETIKSLQEIRM